MWLLYLRFDDRGQVKTYHVGTGSKASVMELIARAECHGLTPTARLVEHAAFIANAAIRARIAPNFHFFLHEEFIARWTAVDAPAVAVQNAAPVALPQHIGSQAERAGIPLDEDAINEQRALLTAHRRRLANQLHRLALLGDAHAPPDLTLDIADARGKIARVKKILRENGAKAPDHPDDTPD